MAYLASFDYHDDETDLMLRRCSWRHWPCYCRHLEYYYRRPPPAQGGRVWPPGSPAWSRGPPWRAARRWRAGSWPGRGCRSPASCWPCPGRQWTCPRLSQLLIDMCDQVMILFCGWPTCREEGRRRRSSSARGTRTRRRWWRRPRGRAAWAAGAWSSAWTRRRWRGWPGSCPGPAGSRWGWSPHCPRPHWGPGKAGWARGCS